jgi:asparagine synthase (glutamine-hydrolysing)
LPQDVLTRKDKMGFPVPLTEWYKGPLKEFIYDILFGQKAKNRNFYNMNNLKRFIENERSFGRAIWGILCLEMWFREFID